VQGLWRNHDGFPFGEEGSAWRSLGIAGTEVAAFFNVLAIQKPLRMIGGKPAAFLRDANGNYVVFVSVDGFQNRSSGQ
jgi:hypothetical protein